MSDKNQTVADAALLRQIAAGDREAFAELFRRRRGNVYRFALHMTGEAAVADDVTQEVFLVVMRDAAHYRPRQGSVVAWLCGIARNHARRRLARQWRNVSLTDAAMSDDGEGPAAALADPVVDVQRADMTAAVRAAVLDLPIPYREAVALCDLQELSYVEAAEALGCAVGTVRSRLHRGRTMLAERLAAQDARRWIA